MLRRLAVLEPTDLPVLSIYLDLRPEATGQRPALRSGFVVLKDRLREIERTLGPRGEALDSLLADSERIERFVESDLEAATEGLALFACSGRGIWEALQAGVPFENQVSAGPVPDLFQLARLDDEFETALIAVVDTNTARLFVSVLGWLSEIGGPDEDSVHFQKRQTGGWSQKRYQRHIEKHRRDFAEEMAREIEAAAERHRASRLILAGDEVAIPLLQEALSPRTLELMKTEPLRIDMRATLNDVQAEVQAVLREIEAEEGRAVAEELVGLVQAGGLGAAGDKAVRKALERGQVDVLVLAEDASLTEEDRADLVRQAAATGARVEVVQDHEAVQRLGGVGAILRYRLD